MTSSLHRCEEALHGFGEKGRMKGWMEVMLMQTAFQTPARKPLEGLGKSCRGGNPSLSSQGSTGQGASPAAPALLHIAQPAWQEKPQQDSSSPTTVLFITFSILLFFFSLFKIISLCLSLFCWSKIDTAAHNKPPWAVSDVSSKGKYRKMSWNLKRTNFKTHFRLEFCSFVTVTQ